MLLIGSGQQINMGAISGDPAGMCVATADRRLEMDGLVLESVRLKGYHPEGAAVPAASGVRMTRTVSTCAGESAWVTASGATAGSSFNWSTLAQEDDGTAGTLTDCADPACPGTTGCSGEYSILLVPGESIESCDEFQYVFARFRGGEVTTTAYRPDADCLPGEGRAQLVPIRIGDEDEDGSYHVTYRPALLTGTGALTSRAVITATTVVSAPTSGLKAVRPGNTFRFTSTDTLDLPLTEYVALSGTQSHAGGLGGSAVFIAEEVDESALWSPQVDLTWTCGTGDEAAPASQGYKLALETIGCGLLQALTLRPRLDTSPKRIEWEFYGQPDQPYITPVQTVLDGHAFAFDLGRLSIDATLLAATPQAATLRIDGMTWDGVTICTPGTYTLPLE